MLRPALRPPCSHLLGSARPWLCPRPDRPTSLPPPQADTTLFAEFQAWRESPTLDKDSPFLGRVYREDVGPCLDFTAQEVSGRGQPAGPAPPPGRPHRPTAPWSAQLSALVRAAVEDNTLTIEPVASHTPPTGKAAAAAGYGSTK